jgi:hypothetical protein
MSVRVPKKKPTYIRTYIHTYIEGILKVTVHGASSRRKAYIQWGAVWFPKGTVKNPAISAPVPCSLQHDTFHLDLGKPEPC